MSLRALLYRRPTEPQTIQIVFDQAIYPVRIRRHRQARRYTLRIHAATREVILTMPPRGSVREAKEFAQKHGGWIAARLRRLPEAAPFADGTVLPLRGIQHRIVHRPGVRGTVWTETGARWRGVALRRRPGAAYQPPRRRFPSPRGVARSRGRQPPRRRAVRRHDQAHLGARPVEPLGLVLDHRRAVVFLASDPRAALRAGLSRGARGRASDRDEPLAAVLAAGSRRLRRMRTAPRRGSTFTAPICTASACRAAPSRTRQPPDIHCLHANMPASRGHSHVKAPRC